MLDIIDNYKKINVEAEENDEDSVLSFYKILVKLRKENKIIQDGDINFIEHENDDVVAYRRSLDDKELIVLCNFKGNEAALTEKTLSDYTTTGYKKILGNYNELAENLRPYEVVVFER